MLQAVLQFSRKIRPSSGWSRQDLAEFYRVEGVLIQSGLRIESDQGVTDEGDPWFVFCRQGGDDPVVHFARIRGEYIIAGPAFGGIVRGRDFRSMVQDLISLHRLLPGSVRPNGNLFLHPTAILVAIVGAAFFRASDASAADTLGDQFYQVVDSDAPHGQFDRGSVAHHFASVVDETAMIEMNRNYALAVLASAAVLLDINSPQSVFTAWTVVPLLAPVEINPHASSPPRQMLVADLLDLEAPAVYFINHMQRDNGSSSIEQVVPIVSIIKELQSDFEKAIKFAVPDGLDFSAITQANVAFTNIAHFDQAAYEPSPILAVPLWAVDDETLQVTPLKPGNAIPQIANFELAVSSGSIHNSVTVLFEHMQGLHDFAAAAQFLLSFQDGLTLALAPEKTLNVVIVEQGISFPSYNVAPAPIDKIKLSSSSAQGGVELSSVALSEILLNYLRDNGNSKLTISRDNYILSPDHADNMASVLESFTVKFYDGSAISLVGQHSAIQHVIDVLS